MSSRTTAIVILALLAAAAPLSAGSLKGTVKAPGGRGAAGAVVYVGQIPGKTFPPPAAHAKVDQKGMVFLPHVQAVLVGTTVDFLNSDPVLHNVFSPDKCAEKFNLGSWPQGQIRSYTFKQPCVATLLCNVHPEMEAFVVAVPTPYFAVTAKDGSYAIAELPDGAYTVKAWHPKLKEASRALTVTGATTADFELKK
ncbi:MAG TPA: carboxypeptidase regulatory-like domain-containing protein [Thermoanaerobaculia bacterium]